MERKDKTMIRDGRYEERWYPSTLLGSYLQNLDNQKTVQSKEFKNGKDIVLIDSW